MSINTFINACINDDVSIFSSILEDNSFSLDFIQNDSIVTIKNKMFHLNNITWTDIIGKYILSSFNNKNKIMNYIIQLVQNHTINLNVDYDLFQFSLFMKIDCDNVYGLRLIYSVMNQIDFELTNQQIIQLLERCFMKSSSKCSKYLQSCYDNIDDIIIEIDNVNSRPKFLSFLVQTQNKSFNIFKTTSKYCKVAN